MKYSLIKIFYKIEFILYMLSVKNIQFSKNTKHKKKKGGGYIPRNLASNTRSESN